MKLKKLHHQVVRLQRDVRNLKRGIGMRTEYKLISDLNTENSNLKAKIKELEGIIQKLENKQSNPNQLELFKEI